MAVVIAMPIPLKPGETLSPSSGRMTVFETPLAAPPETPPQIRSRQSGSSFFALHDWFRGFTTKRLALKENGGTSSRFDASRRGKKMLNSKCDKNEGAHRIRVGGGEVPAT